MTTSTEVWSPATLLLSTGRKGLCGFVPDGTLKNRYDLDARRCNAPSAYLVTSKYLAEDMIWEVCIDHAAEARQMKWLERIWTAPPPIKHIFSCRFGYAPCSCT